MTKFEIKNHWSYGIIFSLECGSLKLCIEAAVKRGIDLAWANLAAANLVGARLVAAYLTRTNFYGANLTRANLAEANLTGTNFAGANLTGADLTGAYLDGVKGINTCRTDSIRLLLDQPGKIRAYILVTKDGIASYNGGSIYEVGRHYEVSDADTNETRFCAAGINLCDVTWTRKKWKPGYRILIAEFEAKDIAAIPLGIAGKFRVHRCDIVGEKDVSEWGLGEAASVKDRGEG